MRTILTGIDFSPESELAVEHALALARRLGCTVTLAVATFLPDLPEGLSPSMMASYQRFSADLGSRLQSERARLEELRQRYVGQGVELSHVILDGRPEDALPQAAKDLNALAVVVGSHGRTGLRRIAMGSVAEKIVRVEERPVLVARGPAPRGGYQRVVVGLDFAPAAKKALLAARDCLAPGGSLELLHCWQLPLWSYAGGAPMISDNVAQFRQDMLADLQRTGERWLSETGSIDGSVSFHVLERPASVGLDDWARERKADLIVVGSHGYRGLQRWLIGSVAEATVRHAHTSVLVVH
ncbi:MAG: universal stress protein [Myxococcales bacterium]|nr:universal stress protein [Myxococcales bacterium]